MMSTAKEDPLLVLSCSAIDFGELPYALGIRYEERCLTITNPHATRTVTVRGVPADDQQEEFPVGLCVASQVGGEDVASSLELRLLPLQSVPLWVRLVAVQHASGRHQRTSFFKVSSALRLLCNAHSEAAQETETARTEGSETWVEVECEYTAMLCTSVLYLDTAEITLDSCVAGETYTRAFQIWNRSESVLSYCIEFMGGAGADVPSAPFVFRDEESEEEIGVGVHAQAGPDGDSGTALAIPPFASRRICITFHAKDVGVQSFRYRVRNLHNPSNLEVLSLQANVKLLREVASCAVRLEDDDNDADHDANLIEAIVQAQRQTQKGEGSDEEGEAEQKALFLGDFYCGHRQMKRYWLGNDSAFPIEVKISIDRGRGHVRVLQDEIKIHSLGHLMDEAPSQGASVAKFRQEEERRKEGEVASSTSAPSRDRDAPGGQSSEVAPFKAPVLMGVAELAASSVADTRDAASPQGSLLEYEAPATAPATVPAGKSGPPRPPKKDKVVGGGGATTSTSQSVSSAESQERDYEVLAAVTWAQLDPYKSKSALSSSVSSSSSASLSSKGATPASSSVGQLSVSSICARQWGQESVAVELCGAMAAEGVQPAEEGFLTFDPSIVSERRLFIGSTSKAVRKSRATMTFEKLYNLVEGGGQAEVIAPVSAGDTDAPSDQEEPLAPDSSEGAVPAPVTPLVEVEDSKDAVREKAEPKIKPKDALLQITLEPHERRQVTLTLCPSFHFIDDETGRAIDGKLLARSIPLLLEWRYCPPSSSDAPQPPLVLPELALLHWSLHFRACASLISVSPKVYDLGLCSVGEYRTAILEVTNESELPALVFPAVPESSDVLDVAKAEREVHIAPRETMQVRVGYIARTEASEYVDSVALVNAYNAADSKSVTLTARNVDTHQVLLHSMFYKLITYNNKRQLQVHFEKGFVNMPNPRMFSIKNVHSHQLDISIRWRSSSIRLFLVTVPPPSEERPEGETAKAGLEVVLTRPDRAASIPPSVVSSASTTTVVSDTRDDDIEDLKWGDDQERVTTRMRRSLSIQPVEMQMRGNRESFLSMSGDDGSVNYGKGRIEAKLSNYSSSSSLLCVLDVQQPHHPPHLSAQLSSASANGAAEDFAPGPLTESAAGKGGDGTGNGAGTAKARGDKAQVRFMPDVREAGGGGGGGGGGDQQGQELTPEEASADVLTQLVSGSFPFNFIVNFESLEDLAAGLKEQRLRKLRGAGDRAAPPHDDYSEAKQKRPSKSEERHSVGAALSQDSTRTEKGENRDNRENKKSDVELWVKAVQKAYAELQGMMAGASAGRRYVLKELVPTEAPEGGNIVRTRIPVGDSFRFALVYEPQQSGNAEDVAEYSQVMATEELLITLPNISSGDVESALQKKNPVDASDPEHGPKLLKEGDSLRARVLPIRACLARSELVVIQKNISFGRTVLGDKTSRTVTVVNRSSLPCLYAVSKSGSISSGFLQVPEGRKGIIPPFSSKYIEFIFQPKMAGTFEEVLQIKNILNPRDSQSITIKAKVSKAEIFVISPHLTAIGAREDPAENSSSMESHYRQFLEAVLAASRSSSASTLSASIDAPFSGPSLASAAVNLGNAAVGEPCECLLSFRIKNTTTKLRQFIVDATHANAVVLLLPAPPQQQPEADDALTSHPVDLLSAEHFAFAAPFDPIPQTLQSVLCLRCRFESEVSTGAGAGLDAGKENLLSNDERKALEDSLEHYQQKLKIAIRKSKPDKIEKYQQKIARVIDELQNNRKTGGASEGADVDADAEEIKEASTAAPPAAADPSRPVGAVVAGTGTDTRVEESEVTYHFYLEPEQEKLISIKLCFLPSESYRYWAGLLPFRGYLRVFECRNEDHVKTVEFGAMVRSSPLAISTTVPFSSVVRARCVSGADRDLLAGVETELGAEEVGEEEGDRSDDKWTALKKARQPFIATVAQWSSLPTREIYPRYRQLPQHMLACCIKLVQATRDRVMYGALSIASMMEHAGSLVLTIDQDFSAAVSSEYTTYDAKKHGPISFGLSLAGAGEVQEDSIGTVHSSDTGASSSFAIVIGAAGQTVSRSKKDTVMQERGHQAPKLSAGSTVDFSVRWRPPLDLQQPKAQESAQEQNAQLKILGAIKAQFRMGEEAVGSPQCIPFIGVLRHKSSFKVDKYFALEEVPVGSYRKCRIAIANSSSAEEMHYVVSSEQVSATSALTGALGLVSGQAGIIPPAGTNYIEILFSATGAGKFEQRLWIRNIRDSFDQKRIVIQASVSVAQTKFVIFPDLEYASAGSGSGGGKFQTIDLGAIQIQSPIDEDVLALLPPVGSSSYQLNVQNVSGKQLSVTAVSNLKSQCYIYADEACQQLAIYCPLPAFECTTLYVVIRPVSVAASGRTGISGPWHGSSLGGAAQSGAGADSTLATRDEGRGAGGVPSPDGSVREEGARSRKQPAEASRELQGGIKLVFFSMEASGDEAPLVLDGSPRKLFETAISFKARVGKSRLKLKPLPNSLQYVQLARPGEGEGRPAHCFLGKFELKNYSQIFPLRYAYVVGAEEECVGREPVSLADARLRFAHDLASKFDLRLKLLDSAVGELAPGEARCVEYLVQHSQQSAGLALCPLRVVNLSTMERQAVTLATFLDPLRLQSSSLRLGQPAIGPPVSEPVPALLGTCGAQEAEKEEASLATSRADVDGDAEVCADANSVGGFMRALPLTPVQCCATLWVCAQPATETGAGAGKSKGKGKASSDRPHLREGGELDLVAEEAEEALGGVTDPCDSPVMVHGASAELCSWVIRNTQPKAITIFPVSDMPLIIEVENMAVTLTTDGGLDSDAGWEGASTDHVATRSRAGTLVPGKLSSAYSSKVSPMLLRWKKSLRRCGEAFTVEASGAVRVSAVVRCGAFLKEEQLEVLGGQRRLESGRVQQLGGVVLFLQAAHSLQSLFDPAPAPKVERDDEREREALRRPSAPDPEVREAKGDGKGEGKGRGTLQAFSCVERYDVLPIVSITALTCSIAAASLCVPETDFELGSLRCGHRTTFEVALENRSEVDMPCTIGALPHWLRLAKYALNSLHHSREGSVTEGSDKGELVGASPACDRDSSDLARPLPLSVTPLYAGLSKGMPAGGLGRAESSLGAQKLHWWMASNGATIANQNQSQRDTASQSTTPPLEVSLDSAAAVALLQRHTQSPDTALEELRLRPNGAWLEDDSHSAQSPFHHDSLSRSAEQDADLDLDAYAQGLGLQLASLEVHHELTMGFGMGWRGEGGSRAGSARVRGGFTPTLGDASDSTFVIPSSSRVWLTFTAVAPVVPSQLLQCVVEVRNLTTLMPNEDKAPEKGGDSVADCKRVHVSLQVDATRALELIPAIDETFIPLKHYSDTPNTLSEAAQAPEADQDEPRAEERGAEGTTYVRLIQEPFLVPPPVLVTMLEEGVPDGGGDVLPVLARTEQSKSHCRFSLKNKLKHSVRIDASIHLNPAVAALLDLRVKFQTNNSEVIELVPEEATAVKIRVLPKLGARLEGAGPVHAYPLSEILQAAGSGDNPMAEEGAAVRRGSTAALGLGLGLGTGTGTGLGAGGATDLDGGGSQGSLLTTSGVTMGQATLLSLNRDKSADSLGAESGGGGGCSAVQRLARQSPILLGTVHLTPSTLGTLGRGKASRSHSHSSASTTSSATWAEASSVLQQDIIRLDIVGFLRPGPTSAIAFRLQPTLPAPAAAGVHATGNTSVTAKEVASSSASASTPAPSSSVAPTLAFCATKRDAGKSAGLDSQLSPTLRMDKNELFFYLANPSAAAPLNFEIKAQSYRHAGMRLLLSAGKGRSAAEGAEEEEDEESNDTVYPQAFPERGVMPPSSCLRVLVRLVPGKVSEAVKSASTLTDMPDLFMRERRLRPHYDYEPSGTPHQDEAQRGGDSGNGTSTSAVGVGGAPTSASSDAPPTALLPASTAPDVDLASISVSASASAPFLSSATATATIVTPLGAAATTNGAAATAAAASTSAAVRPGHAHEHGPYTIACMPLQVLDLDNPSHPATLVHTYLTSEVPLPILLTQPLSETNRNKQHLDRPITKAKEIAAKEQAAKEMAAKEVANGTGTGVVPALSAHAPAPAPSPTPTPPAGESLGVGAAGIAQGENSPSTVPAPSAAASSLSAESSVEAGGSAGRALPVTAGSATTGAELTTMAGDTRAPGAPPALDSDPFLLRDRLSGVGRFRLRGLTPDPRLPNRYSIDLGQQAQKREALEWLLTLENCSDEVPIPFRIHAVFKDDASTWLTIGQTGGAIEAGDSRSVMLYFRRTAPGAHITYLVVENRARPDGANDQVIRVAMEVVQDMKRGLSADGGAAGAAASLAVLATSSVTTATTATFTTTATATTATAAMEPAAESSASSASSQGGQGGQGGEAVRAQREAAVRQTSSGPSKRHRVRPVLAIEAVETGGEGEACPGMLLFNTAAGATAEDYAYTGGPALLLSNISDLSLDVTVQCALPVSWGAALFRRTLCARPVEGEVAPVTEVTPLGLVIDAPEGTAVGAEPLASYEAVFRVAARSQLTCSVALLSGAEPLRGAGAITVWGRLFEDQKLSAALLAPHIQEPLPM